MDESSVELVAGQAGASIGYREAQENLTMNLKWLKVLAALRLASFDGSIKWLAQELSFTEDEVNEAIEGLQVLGHVEKVQGRFQVRREPVEMISTLENDPDFLKRYVLLQHQLIEQTVSNQTALRIMVWPSTMEIMLELHQKVQDAMREAAAKSVEAGSDELFVFSYQLSSPTPWKTKNPLKGNT